MAVNVAPLVSEGFGRQVVMARAEGRCEICQRPRALEWSHRRSRAQGGGWSPANGLGVCRDCHAWCEANPTQADACGWRIVHRDTPPAEVPVWLHPYGMTGWYLLWPGEATYQSVRAPVGCLDGEPPHRPDWVTLPHERV